MRHFLLISLFLLNLPSFSQDLENGEEPNSFDKKMAHFYKDTWKPFSGNVIVTDEELHLTTKIRFVNGFEALAELYDKDQKLVQKLVNGQEVKLVDSNKNSEFSKTDSYAKVSDIKSVYVIVSYFQDSKTKKKTKFSGVLKTENSKIYYTDGETTKIENYYDEDLIKVKDSHKIFHTGIGNLEATDEETSSYDGDYKIWDKNGVVIEEGQYVEGKKAKEQRK